MDEMNIAYIAMREMVKAGFSGDKDLWTESQKNFSPLFHSKKGYFWKSDQIELGYRHENVSQMAITLVHCHALPKSEERLNLYQDVATKLVKAYSEIPKPE